MRLPLFAYGTLLEPSVQEALWGAAVEVRPARLHGWKKAMAADGHPFVVPRAASEVKGGLLSLTQDQVWRADTWEALPAYARRRLLVRAGTAGEAPVLAEAYLRQDGAGHVQGRKPERLADTVQAAQAVARQVTTSPLPVCDAWLVIRGHRDPTQELPEPVRPLAALGVLMALDKAAGDDRWRRGLPEAALKAGQGALTQRGAASWAWQGERVVASWALPALHLPLANRLANWHLDQLQLLDPGEGAKGVSLETWLARRGVTVDSQVHLLLFAQAPPAEMARLQPDTSVEAAPHVTLVLPAPFDDTWEQRLRRQAAAVVALESRLLAGPAPA